MKECSLVESLRRFIGQTVTIFTTSGGLSGEGFTGVLASVSECTVKLITDFGAAPSCPLGSGCNGSRNNGWGENGDDRHRCGCRQNCRERCDCDRDHDRDREGGRNWVGSVTEIPICKIASFTHNAI